MKDVLFNHVDSSCQRTSTHFEGESARPAQKDQGRDVHRCTCRNYVSGDVREWYGQKRCWEGDEFMFHNFKGGHWMTNADTKPDMNTGGTWNCYGAANEVVTPPCCGQDSAPFYSSCTDQP